MLFNFCIFFVNVLVISVRWNETDSSPDVSQSPINMKESERVKGQKVKSKVKGQKESRGALAREVMRRGKERRKVVLFFPFSCYPSCSLRRSRFSREKEDDNSGKWIHCLTNAREQKKPAITSLRPHSKMVNNPFFLIKSNPVNTVPNGPKKFGVINGWPY